MWWAVLAARQGQVIQDRWCASRTGTGALNQWAVGVRPRPGANADGDPAAEGICFRNSWSLQCGVLEGSLLTGTF